MEAVAHNSKFAKRVGIPQSVGQDFHKADMKKKRKFDDGGLTVEAKPLYKDSRYDWIAALKRGDYDSFKEISRDLAGGVEFDPSGSMGGLSGITRAELDALRPTLAAESAAYKASVANVKAAAKANKVAKGVPTPYRGAPSPQNRPLYKDRMSDLKQAKADYALDNGYKNPKSLDFNKEPERFEFNDEDFKRGGHVKHKYAKGGNVKRKNKFAMGGNMPMQGMPIPRPAPGMMSNMDAQGMQPPNIPGQVGGLQGMPPQGMPMGYKKGGHVKRKYAEGGKMETKVANYFAKKGEKSLATHEKREAQGKEEDTKAIAKKEERVLKGAPKGLRDYEKKEHKDMGFKRGGFRKPSRKAKMPSMDPSLAAAMSAAPSQAPAPDMGQGGGMTGMKKGGMAKGVERKGSTSAKKVKMARGGGIESKGKTKGRMC